MLKNRFPNQYKVIINKEKVNQNDAEKRYFIAYQETIEAAASELNGNEFKLYIYFLANKDGYESFFSPTDVKRCYGMSEDTARKAFHKLIELGYLVKTAAHDVEFYDRPIKKKKFDFIEEERLISMDGELKPFTFKAFEEELKQQGISDVNVILSYWNNPAIAKSQEVK